MERKTLESASILTNGMTAETVVDVIVVFTEASYVQSSVRMTGPLLEVLKDVYFSLNDRDEEEEAEYDFTTLKGVRFALSCYSERAGDDDDVWTIINLADMTKIS